jgi:hypothetical protein
MAPKESIELIFILLPPNNKNRSPAPKQDGGPTI